MGAALKWWLGRKTDEEPIGAGTFDFLVTLKEERELFSLL
jgi:hypothetical protein